MEASRLSTCTQCVNKSETNQELSRGADCVQSSAYGLSDASTPSAASPENFASQGFAEDRSKEYVPLIPADKLMPNSVEKVVLKDGHCLAVYRLGDEYFVSDDLCTHGEASLADGDIEDGLIVCPYHQGSFDIRTGEARAYPCVIPLQVYPVQIQAGTVSVLLDRADPAKALPSPHENSVRLES